MKRQNDRELRDELVKLRAEHRELDDEIVRLESSGTADQLLVKRLKKRKLQLKDQITSVEDQLLPTSLPDRHPAQPAIRLPTRAGLA